jgi:AraC-like DNA-binding protein
MALELPFDGPVARRVGGVAVERPRDQLPQGVPVAVRTAQHMFVARGRFEQFTSRRVVLVQWVISGEAAMRVGGRVQRYGPRQVAVYLPSAPMQFWAVAPVSEMCWFTLDGPLAEQFALECELTPGVHTYGPAPLEQVLALMASLRDHTVQGWRMASLRAIRLLYEVANVIRSPEVSTAVVEAKRIIQQEFADPDLSVESIAQRLHYHRGSLSRLFHETTGVALMDYLTEVRLQEARALLQHSNEKVSEVARRCGFRESAYFCRWVRKHTGAPPTRLRNGRVA